MRWADMDLLGHVNNVTYLEYAAQARDHVAPNSALGRASVLGHRVAFVAPLVFRREPVLVDTWVAATTAETLSLGHEVYGPEGGRTTYARISTVLGVTADRLDGLDLGDLRADDHEWRPMPGGPDGGGQGSRDAYRLTLRRGDLDETGAVRDAAVVEYFQEARIQYLMNLHTRGQEWSHVVVARTDVDYLAPLRYRQEPCEVRSWVEHVGGRSFTMGAELGDEDRVYARARVVLVTFDTDSQRPQEMTASQRERLCRELEPTPVTG